MVPLDRLGNSPTQPYVLGFATPTPATRLMRFFHQIVAAALMTLPTHATLTAQTGDGVDVIPRPQAATRGRGSFTLTSQTTIWSDKADSAVARRFARGLATATGLDLPVRIGTSASGKRIVFRRASARDTALGPEGYRLEASPSVVTITASTPAGAFYATQTIRQLLPPAVFRSAVVAGTEWTIPAVTIEDRRRFQWSGAHLDVG